MTLEERAWSIINELRDGWCDAPCNYSGGCGCSDAIAQALRTVRNDALEEAAKVAGERSAILPNQNDFTRGYANGRGGAASAIRSLKTEVSMERETG